MLVIRKKSLLTIGQFAVSKKGEIVADTLGPNPLLLIVPLGPIIFAALAFGEWRAHKEIAASISKTGEVPAWFSKSGYLSRESSPGEVPLGSPIVPILVCAVICLLAFVMLGTIPAILIGIVFAILLGLNYYVWAKKKRAQLAQAE